ncbi:MAG: MiaB/RimO family radical SAM methylthiotransferase, partial [Chloroflexi bacterium]|nr:MiaB/RimO family radical SAM methylthiotransferase [Chloroflexota bacterium]
MARQLARVNPTARIVLTGCYATMAPREARALPNVALVVPNREKDFLVERVAKNILPIADCAVSAIQSTVISHQSPVNFSSPLDTRHTSLRTRAFVKIADGCNMSCTYCIIPLARGKERSRPLREIVAEVQRLVAAGYQEIVLTGVQISEYRDNVIASAEGVKQSPNNLGIASAQSARLAMTPERARGLRDLVNAILSETAVPRLRLTSIAPWDFDARLLELWRDARLCRHLHFSLQSGSDSVLQRMRRPYTTEKYLRAVEMAREKIPEVGITTDVIVGFPGESEAEFAASAQFVESIGFARVHVFPYSPREGTLAAQLPHRVSDRDKDARVKEMELIAHASARKFAEKFLGREIKVLWEAREEKTDTSLRAVLSEAKELRSNPQSIAKIASSHGVYPERSEGLLAMTPSVTWTGHTDNYIRVTT